MNEQRVKRFLDESEIRSVMIRERFHRDHEEWDDWRKTFHPDPTKTHIHTSLYQGDIDGFIAMTRNSPGHFFDSFHTVDPAVIDVDNKKALVKSLGTVNASFELQGRRYDCVADVVMMTKLEYSSEGWRITAREGVYRRSRITPATPTELVDVVDTAERRSCCRHLDWLAEHGGKVFDRNVLGFDRPEGVTTFLKAAKQWLCEQDHFMTRYI